MSDQTKTLTDEEIKKLIELLRTPQQGTDYAYLDILKQPRQPNTSTIGTRG